MHIYSWTMASVLILWPTSEKSGLLATSTSAKIVCTKTMHTDRL